MVSIKPNLCIVTNDHQLKKDAGGQHEKNRHVNFRNAIII